eukprot:85461-Chlamydomonas_euryale.AAC.1
MSPATPHTHVSRHTSHITRTSRPMRHMSHARTHVVRACSRTEPATTTERSTPSVRAAMPRWSECSWRCGRVIGFAWLWCGGEEV